eukprot:COSAG01_NODE_5569_length_4176_cov_7.015943_1_plen_522_part_00
MAEPQPKAQAEEGIPPLVGEYPSTGNRGQALIISMEEMPLNADGSHSRPGGRRDRERLETLLGKLGFRVVSVVDQPASAIQAELLAAEQSAEHGDNFLCVLMAHGAGGQDTYIVAADGERIYLSDDVFSRFKGSRCPGLRGKPKVFLINACRGHEEMAFAAAPEPQADGEAAGEVGAEAAATAVAQLGAWCAEAKGQLTDAKLDELRGLFLELVQCEGPGPEAAQAQAIMAQAISAGVLSAEGASTLCRGAGHLKWPPSLKVATVRTFGQDLLFGQGLLAMAFGQYSVPVDADSDLMVAFSTLPDYVSWRSKSKGSWFISTFVNVLEEHHDREHVADMLTATDRRIKEQVFKKDKKHGQAIEKVERGISGHIYWRSVHPALTNETIREAVKAFCEEGGGRHHADFLHSPTAQAHYGPVSEWNVSEVTDMKELFKDCRAFNQPLGEWQVGQVTDMRGMFRGAKAFNQPLEEWQVGQVTHMSGMFRGAKAFNQPLGEWQVGSDTDMCGMFEGAVAFASTKPSQ